MTDLIAAEWLKLRTTRLLLGVVPATVLLSVAAVAGSIYAADRGHTVLASSEGLRRVLPVTGTGALVMLLTGIVIAAGEYRHSTAADTFLTTPRRHRVVLAKLAVGAFLGVFTAALTAATCVVAAWAIYASKGTEFPIGDSEVWSAVTGTLLYVTLFAVLGVAVGTMIRNQVLAVALSLAWLAIVEHILVGFVPSLGRWLPAAAGQAIVRTPIDDLLSPAVGAVVLVAYTAAIAAAGIRFATTRDA